MPEVETMVYMSPAIREYMVYDLKSDVIARFKILKILYLLKTNNE